MSALFHVEHCACDVNEAEAMLGLSMLFHVEHLSAVLGSEQEFMFHVKHCLSPAFLSGAVVHKPHRTHGLSGLRCFT